jgi:predicted HAD superfamily Cof-like phosphohydrolase
MSITLHYGRVLDFMQKAKQACPEKPTIPDAKVRILRAKLMLEEVLETVRGLGVEVIAERVASSPADALATVKITAEAISKLSFYDTGEVDLVEVADGCADVAVVTSGTLIACGIKDEQLQYAVDQNNLEKFLPGHSWSEAGKLLKPPGHKPPDIKAVLVAQGWISP